MSRVLDAIPWVEVNRPCICCGTEESELKHVHHYEIVPRPFVLRVCAECGLLFNSPRLADLAPLYEQDYYVFSETELTRYDRALAEVSRHLDPGLGIPPGALEILEVGSARGHLLHILKHMGHRAMGVEISGYASEWSSQWFGAEVWQGTIEGYATSPAARRFDLVWCNDVVEHVPDPLAFLRSCAAVLKPGGRLILDTPNGGSADVLAGHPDWIGYNPFHIFLFNKDNLARLCRRVGLEPVAAFSYQNHPTVGRQGRVRKAVSATLRAVGLLGLAKRIRQVLMDRDGELKRRPMEAGEIDRRLSGLPWFSETDDARAELAVGCRGNNLVIHAVPASEEG